LNDASTNSTGLFTNLPANTYVFNIKDAAGCNVDTTITLTTPSDIIYDTLITPTCWNKESGILSLSSLGGTPPYMYSFNLGTANTQNQFNNLAAGIYNVKVIDANNCTKAFTITVPTYQAFTISETNVPSTCADPKSASIELTVNNGNAPYSYSWNGFSNTSNILNNILAGSYIVTVSDANNCSEIHTYTATSNCCKAWFPNAFTCNGDGKNETFMPQYSYGLNDVDLKIFDRWGELLYHTKDKTKGWDGTFHGRYCEVGTYYYLMKGTCDNGKVEYKGDISLIR
jgi:gliding motility-associated-like protein